MPAGCRVVGAAGGGGGGGTTMEQRAPSGDPFGAARSAPTRCKLGSEACACLHTQTHTHARAQTPCSRSPPPPPPRRRCCRAGRCPPPCSPPAARATRTQRPAPGLRTAPAGGSATGLGQPPPPPSARHACTWEGETLTRTGSMRICRHLLVPQAPTSHPATQRPTLVVRGASPVQPAVLAVHLEGVVLPALLHGGLDIVVTFEGEGEGRAGQGGTGCWAAAVQEQGWDWACAQQQQQQVLASCPPRTACPALLAARLPGAAPAAGWAHRRSRLWAWRGR